MPTTESALERAIAPSHSVLADTSVILAYLDGTEPTSRAAMELVDAFAATGRNPVSISAVTAAELLVRPFRVGPDPVAIVEGFPRHFADLEVRAVTYAVAREAARIRAATSLPMPDAMIAATASAEAIDVLATNDRSWLRRLRPAIPDVEIVVLSGLG